MLLFPLPFLTAFFLIFLLLHLSRYVSAGLPGLVLVTVAAYALQSVLLGLQWGLGTVPPVVLILLANLLPPLTWLALHKLAGQSFEGWRIGVACGIALLVTLNACLVFGFANGLDVVAITNYSIFGLHLIWQGWRKELDWLSNHPLNSILPVQRTFMIAGAVLVGSACVDAIVLADIQWNHTKFSSALVGYSNLTLLVLLSVIFFRAGAPSRRVATEPPAPPHARTVQTVGVETAGTEEGAQEILDLLDAEMTDNHLYRNENLTLDQIARRIRMPARQVSAAVNSLRAMNVPQYVNTFRIQDACRILESTDMPVTSIVFEVGFTTKSNFNREFQRVTGLTPSDWRNRARAHPPARGSKEKQTDSAPMTDKGVVLNR